METENDQSLDRALNKLDMLSTITDARKEYLNEMRMRGVRSDHNSSWRYQRSEPSNINGSVSSLAVAKENFRQRSYSSSSFHTNGIHELASATASTSTSSGDSNGHLNKFHNRHYRSHHHHSRISPYGYGSINRRRPLNNLTFGSSAGSSASTTSSSSNASINISSTSTDDNNGHTIASALSSFTHFLKEHQKLQHKEQQELLTGQCSASILPGTSTKFNVFSTTPTNNTLFSENGIGIDKNLKSNILIGATAAAAASNTMTEDNLNPTIVSSLTRSKSLEDLRESIKPKPKSLSSYFSGNINSLDASSLSPRNNYCDFATFQQTFQPTNVEEECRIKKEIDSMSMRIGNLDVG